MLKKRWKASTNQLNKTQRQFNKWARLRDCLATTGNPEYGRCISCGILKQFKRLNGGHYIPEGNCAFLRYHPDNIHAQCTQCNNYKSGNLIEYMINLVKKIGEDKVKWLEENRHKLKSWTPDECSEIYQKYKRLFDELISEL